MKGKKRFKKQVYREFPPNVMVDGGYLPSNYEEQFNIDKNFIKQPKQQIGVGENIGLSLLDAVTSPVSLLTGKPLSGYISNKYDPVTGSKGSSLGNIKSQYIDPAITSLAKAVPIPGFDMIGKGIDAIHDTVAPMTLQNDPKALARQNAVSSIADPLAGIAGGIAGMGMGTGMNSDTVWGKTNQRMGGKLKYAMGGGLADGAESMNMGLNELGGLTHEQGGMGINPQTEVEGGETILQDENYVFSDTLKVPGSKATFASKSKSIKNKYSLRPEDKLSKNAIKVELDDLMNMQDAVKQTMVDKQVGKLDKTLQMMYGGKMRLANGGEYPITGDDYYTSLNKRYGQLPSSDVVGNMLPIDNMGDISAQAGFVGGKQPIQMEDMGSNKIVPLYDEVGAPLPNPNVEPIDPSQSKLGKFNFELPTTALAGIAAGAKGLIKDSPLMLTPNYKPSFVSTAVPQALAQQEANMALATGLGSLKDTTNAGQYMSNVQNIVPATASALGRSIADIRFKGDVQNTEIGNEARKINMQNIANNNALTTQHGTASRLRKDKLIDDASRIGQTSLLDTKQENIQNSILQMLNNGIAKYDKSGGLLIKTDKGWVPYSQLINK